MFNPRTFENARPDGFPVLEIIPRPDRPDSATGQLRQFVPLQRTDLIGEIAGPVAALQLVQRFRFGAEVSAEPIEAAYRFPLPGDAAITGVSVQFGETSIQAELAERQQAEETYKRARDEGRQATLLSREAPDVFTLQVTGVKPGEDVTVRTSYTQLAHAEGDGWSLRLPLTTVPRYVRGDERGSSAADGQPFALLRDPGHRFALDLTVEAAEQVASPTHPLAVEAGEGRLRIRLRDGEVIPDRDCVLTWQPRRQAGRPSFQVLRHALPEGKASCFLALVSPPASGAATALLPRELILLIDHSGSMEGPKWEAADWAVQNLLAGLTPADSFNLGLFHSTTRWFARGPVRGDERTVRQAREFLVNHRDSGGTELGVALEQALRQPRDAEGRARHVLIVTDAQVSDAGRILALVEREAGEVARRRVDVLCIDAAPNDGLANELAERGGGIARFLTSNPAENDIASALDEILTDWAAPVVRNLTVEVAGTAVQAAGRRVTVDPARGMSQIDLGDLPAGRAVWVAGRVEHGHSETPHLRLLADGEPLAETARSEGAASRPAVAALFGARRVLDIELIQTSGIAQEERLRQLGYDPAALVAGSAPVYAENARGELTDALRSLLVRESLAYGIASSATSFVATRAEAGAKVAGTVVVASALAHGWSESFLMPRLALSGGGAAFMAMRASPMPVTFAAPPDVDDGAVMEEAVSYDSSDDSPVSRSASSPPPMSPPTPGAAPGSSLPDMSALARTPLDAARSLAGRLRKTASGRDGGTPHGPASPGRRVSESQPPAAPVFAGTPQLVNGEALLFDSTQHPARLASSNLLSRLSVRIGGSAPMDGGLVLALFVDDLTTPRARVRLADLLRQGGARPLNIRRDPAGVVRLVLLDSGGAWAAGAPTMEVYLS
ncbi:MAG: VWA domain-containing protein [Chloroflexi bacterium]|nr:VWA domain-containing protein [Chloroflexota bacterium]